jgi:uncharacterized membrane protein
MSAATDTRSLPFGPVQMLVLEFDRTRFDGEIMPELERLKKEGIVRLIDLLFVTKRNGEIESVQASDLSKDEAEAFGAIVGALIGAGAGVDDLEGAMGAGAGALSDGHLLDQADVWYLADAIPDGSSAAVALIEHLWAIPFRDKIVAAGGVVLADEWIHPADLVAVGAKMADRIVTQTQT